MKLSYIFAKKASFLNPLKTFLYSGGNFPSLKNKKNVPLKNVLFFGKRNFLAASLKNFLYFRKKLTGPKNQTFLIFRCTLFERTFQI